MEWEDVSDNWKGPTHAFTKGDYTLLCLKSVIGLLPHQIVEAQAWADQTIRARELQKPQSRVGTKVKKGDLFPVGTEFDFKGVSRKIVWKDGAPYLRSLSWNDFWSPEHLLPNQGPDQVSINTKDILWQDYTITKIGSGLEKEEGIEVKEVDLADITKKAWQMWKAAGYSSVINGHGWELDCGVPNCSPYLTGSKPEVHKLFHGAKWDCHDSSNLGQPVDFCCAVMKDGSLRFADGHKAGECPFLLYKEVPKPSIIHKKGYVIIGKVTGEPYIYNSSTDLFNLSEFNTYPIENVIGRTMQDGKIILAVKDGMIVFYEVQEKEVERK
jgi:hypothetical protein